MSDLDVAVLGFHDGSAGQVSAWFEQVTGMRIVCYVHGSDQPPGVDVEEENSRRVSQRTEYPTRDSFRGRPLIVSADWVSELRRLGIGRVLPLNGYDRPRLEQVRECQAAGIELVSAIHPTAIVLDEATIAPGVWVNAGAVIGYKAEIAEGVIVNTRASIDHHNVLEAGVQVDPGVVTAGFVTLRECAHVHTGATIINRVTVGADAIVGAGSVVLDDVEPGATVAGVPARPLRSGR